MDATTGASIRSTPSPRPRKQKSRSTRSAWGRIVRRGTSASSTWRHQPESIRMTSPITGYLQASGLSGRTVRVELISTSDAPDAPETVHEERRVALADDGQIQPVKFQSPPTRLGDAGGRCDVAAPPKTLNRPTISDGQRGSGRTKEPCDAAGGRPQRDYRFLRNLLFRDPNTTVAYVLAVRASGSGPGSQRNPAGVSRTKPRRCSSTTALSPLTRTGGN